MQATPGKAMLPLPLATPSPGLEAKQQVAGAGVGPAVAAPQLPAATAPQSVAPAAPAAAGLPPLPGQANSSAKLLRLADFLKSPVGSGTTVAAETAAQPQPQPAAPPAWPHFEAGPGMVPPLPGGMPFHHTAGACFEHWGMPAMPQAPPAYAPAYGHGFEQATCPHMDPMAHAMPPMAPMHDPSQALGAPAAPFMNGQMLLHHDMSGMVQPPPMFQHPPDAGLMHAHAAPMPLPPHPVAPESATQQLQLTHVPPPPPAVMPNGSFESFMATAAAASAPHAQLQEQPLQLGGTAPAWTPMAGSMVAQGAPVIAPGSSAPGALAAPARTEPPRQPVSISVGHFPEPSPVAASTPQQPTPQAQPPAAGAPSSLLQSVISPSQGAVATATWPSHA